MNNNIFLQNQSNQTLIEKYNPDVLKNYNKITNHMNRNIDYKFVNNYYKSITNNPVKINIRSVDELKLEKDKPDIVKINNSYESTLRNRTEEEEIVKKSIEQYKKLNGIVDKTTEEINNERLLELKKKEEEELLKKEELKNSNIIDYKVTDVEIYDSSANVHLTLKNDFESYNIQEGDRLLHEKIKFNNLLNDLDKLL
jgi:hypothetical protein